MTPNKAQHIKGDNGILTDIIVLRNFKKSESHVYLVEL